MGARVATQLDHTDALGRSYGEDAERRVATAVVGAHGDAPVRGHDQLVRPSPCRRGRHDPTLGHVDEARGRGGLVQDDDRPGELSVDGRRHRQCERGGNQEARQSPHVSRPSRAAFRRVMGSGVSKRLRCSIDPHIASKSSKTG